MSPLLNLHFLTSSGVFRGWVTFKEPCRFLWSGPDGWNELFLLLAIPTKTQRSIFQDSLPFTFWLMVYWIHSCLTHGQKEQCNKRKTEKLLGFESRISCLLDRRFDQATALYCHISEDFQTNVWMKLNDFYQSLFLLSSIKGSEQNNLVSNNIWLISQLRHGNL